MYIELMQAWSFSHVFIQKQQKSSFLKDAFIGVKKEKGGGANAIPGPHAVCRKSNEIKRTPLNHSTTNRGHGRNPQIFERLSCETGVN